MDLKKVLASKNKIIGRNETISALRQGKLSDVLIAKNYPKKEEIESLAKIGGANITVLKQTNDELGVMCKKPFAISVIGVKKK